MGINVPDIRRIFFFGLPLNPPEYWQQAGRAGRDGNPSLVRCYWTTNVVEYK